MEVEVMMRLYLRIAASATAKAFHLGSGSRELAFASGEGGQVHVVGNSASSMLEHALTSFVSATACLRIMATPPARPAHRPPDGGSNL